MGNSMSCKRAISLRDLGFSLSQRESCLSPSVKRGGNKRSIKGEKKEQHLVFHFTDVSELDEILEEIELALGDVLGNKAVERKTSQALETNLNDVGTMFTSMSTKCQDANSHVGFGVLFSVMVCLLDGFHSGTVV